MHQLGGANSNAFRFQVVGGRLYLDYAALMRLGPVHNASEPPAWFPGMVRSTDTDGSGLGWSYCTVAAEICIPSVGHSKVHSLAVLAMPSLHHKKKCSFACSLGLIYDWLPLINLWLDLTQCKP